MARRASIVASEGSLRSSGDLSSKYRYEPSVEFTLPVLYYIQCVLSGRLLPFICMCISIAAHDEYCMLVSSLLLLLPRNIYFRRLEYYNSVDDSREKQTMMGELRLNVFGMFLAHYQGGLLGISGQFKGSHFVCRREKIFFSV